MMLNSSGNKIVNVKLLMSYLDFNDTKYVFKISDEGAVDAGTQGRGSVAEIGQDFSCVTGRSKKSRERKGRGTSQLSQFNR